MISLILECYNIPGCRIPEYRPHLCAVHPIVPMEYARLRRYDKTCHNALTILQFHFFVNSQKINFTLVLTNDNF